MPYSRHTVSGTYETGNGTRNGTNEQISQNPRRVAHCRVSSLVLVCRRSFAAKANLLAIETALLIRRQQSADHKDKVCQVGVTVITEPLLLLALIGYVYAPPELS